MDYKMREEKEIAIENILLMEAAKIISVIMLNEAKKINDSKGIFPAIITELICLILSSHVWSLGINSNENIKGFLNIISNRTEELLKEFIESIATDKKH